MRYARPAPLRTTRAMTRSGSKLSPTEKAPALPALAPEEPACRSAGELNPVVCMSKSPRRRPGASHAQRCGSMNPDLLGLNQLSQGLLPWSVGLSWFSELPSPEKAARLRDLAFITNQAHPTVAEVASDCAALMGGLSAAKTQTGKPVVCRLQGRSGDPAGHSLSSERGEDRSRRTLNENRHLSLERFPVARARTTMT